MGRDLIVQKGLLLKVATVSNLLASQPFDGARERIIAQYQTRMNELYQDQRRQQGWDPEEYITIQQGFVDRYIRTLKATTEMEAIGTLMERIVDDRLAEMNEEDPFYTCRSIFFGNTDGEIDLDYAAELILIKCLCDEVLPVEPMSVCIICDRRSNWNVPHMEPCLRFAFDDCFEIRPTTAGQQVAQILGRKQLCVNEWVYDSF